MELSPSDWSWVAENLVEHGIKYFKITGGEPLVRNDVVEIVRGITDAGGEASMVSNGSLVKKYIDGLVEAGLRQINISLHSLDPGKFYRITRGRLENVLEGIREAVEHDIYVKLDYVVLTWNREEYRDIINYAVELGVDLNIIELIPLGISYNEWIKLHSRLDPIIEYLEKNSVEKKVREFQSRPIYVLPEGIRVAIIRGYCNPELCMKCSRIRMTPEGYIKTCIYRNDQLINARKHILNRDRMGFEKALLKAVEIREPFFKPGEEKSLEEINKYLTNYKLIEV